MTRIAYVSADPGVPVFGTKGSSVHVQEILRAMVHTGARIDLFCARTDGPTPPWLRGHRVHRFDRPSGVDAADRERSCRRLDARIRAALLAAGPFDVVYERYSLFSGAGMAVARRTDATGILEVNSPLIAEQLTHRVLVDKAAAENVLRQSLLDATAVSCVSDPVADYVAGYLGESDARVLVQPNGVNVDRITPRWQVASDPNGHSRVLESRPFTVGFVGTLKPWHGVEILLDAYERLVSRHPQARLLVVGDGPLATLVQERAARSSGRIEAPGAVHPDAMPAWLHGMDVGVAPYPPDAGEYFSPLKVYEYMAAGLPVVASRIGQLPGIVDHERNGILAPAGDAPALASALGELITDPKRRHYLGIAARQSVEQAHAWSAVLRRVFDAAGVDLRPDREVA